uniref:Uncharacterized protein n=1 Tax=Oryza rufipogon TaxID=4529 RepID=A0A0E0QJX2_ORYRU
MEDQLSFFPGGLRVMPVDVVATHTTASAGLCTLSSDNMIDVQTVLCDVKKVVSSGFDFRRVVETEHHITVIYLLSTTEPEQMVAGEDTEFLNHLLLKATYIIRKPLDQATMAQLWRVVAWRRCCLEERIPRDSMDDIAAHAGVVGKDGNDNDVIIIEEPQVHFKVVRSRGSRKRQLTINVDSGSSSDGADANPRQKLEHKKDAKGPLGQHVASHLQEYCTKQQKDLDERRLLSLDSLFLKAILPTLNQQQQPAGTAVISFSNTTVQAPTGNAVISFSNAASPAATGNAVISFDNVAASAAMQAPVMGQWLSGGVQPDAPQQRLYMGPFSYQGPPPPPSYYA